MKSLLMSCCCILAVVLASPLYADDTPPGPPRPGEKREPPPFAFKACEGKAEGDRVTLSGPHGETLKAVCRKFPDGRLCAQPEGGPGKGPRGPGRPD